MKNDIRIVALQKDGVEVYQVSRVLYKEDGNVFYAENPYSEYETLEEAYGFVDQMFKASLKPLLVINSDGSYE
jgi:hypothetical protein